ncbi:MAG TPA: hypothetical protein VI916_03490 [Acidimicrobiia bacterium]|nr:hypothetical protein [Acidimicrobiia bacterium]
MAPPSETPLSRDLAGAVGWALFVGIGFALGLALGSLGADVPTDSGFLVYIGLIVSGATLVIRLGMVVVKRRAGGFAPARRPRPERARIAGAAPYRPRPVERPDARPDDDRDEPRPARKAPAASKAASAKKTGERTATARKSPAKESPARKTAATKATRKKPPPDRTRKR